MNPEPSKDDPLEAGRSAEGPISPVGSEHSTSSGDGALGPLARHFGVLSPEAADEMERAIEECCEQVDPEEWNRPPLTTLDP